MITKESIQQQPPMDVSQQDKCSHAKTNANTNLVNQNATIAPNADTQMKMQTPNANATTTSLR